MSADETPAFRVDVRLSGGWMSRTQNRTKKVKSLSGQLLMLNWKPKMSDFVGHDNPTNEANAP